MGWNARDVVVLHAGNMGIKQGLENVVETARLAEIRGSAVRFVLLGDGNQRRHIEETARDIGHIDILDPLPDAEFTAALRAADILLVNELQGLREMAVPSKLTSYFSTGVPVLAATEEDSTTAFEIRQARAGIRVDPNAPAELLEAAELLGADKQLAGQYGRAGHQYARERLSEEAATVRYSDWLLELASAGRLGRNKND